jgi:uncharacterized protein (TIGR03435 family)
MKRAIVIASLTICAVSRAFSQSSETPPRFEIADVHASAGISSTYFRTPLVHAGRYELKGATMLDLIRTAYGFDADKILGGPSWLEMDRFDILAKLPAGANPETGKLMLQSLLADRFKLALHKDTKPFPAYALTAGKKPQLKEADGDGEAGCKQQPASGPPGSGRTVQYDCRNMTMAAFADGLRRMAGASVGPNPVLDETGLNGKWNFDLTYSLQSNQLTLAAAIDQQLGLKLEERQVPMPAIVVDSVNQKPSANPPGLAEALPPIPVPTEFAVASVKPSDPNARAGRLDVQPGGRVTIQNQPMQLLIYQAFLVTNNDQMVAPKWANTARFDINAEADMPAAAALDWETLRPMMRALLVDRFKMAYHTEERPVTTYSLVSVKPIMKKADPASRTRCKYIGAPPGSPPATLADTCQNITMAQFAEQLRNMAAGSLDWPVTDGTGLDGGWDFTLVFVRSTAVFGARQAGPSLGDVPVASDPTAGYTIFEALEKELGLKLELQKRPMPVIVIDHLEEKPTAN